ncbi:6-pyruvoyl trahydropterin synthase family protein [Actinoplanes philippinensis]|uniref:6-pyruvoyl trahydropterin synthase family protein n=1 Tax=Actinoplanes philippinensis TaxID=35752 RepID=UPI0033DA3274
MGHRIGKRFTFEASHQLPGLPDGHKCGRLHGHSYTVEVTLVAEDLVEPGFVTDFGDLAPFKEHLAEAFDHRHLNEVMTVAPTSENLAEVLAQWFITELEPAIPGNLFALRVSETASSWAEFRPERAA